MPCFLLTDSQPCFWCLAQLQGTSWVTAYPLGTANFIWPFLSVTIIDVQLRPDNSPVATSLLWPAGRSSGPGKLCHMLSIALAAQVDPCCHFLVSEFHLLTYQQVMVFCYKFSLEFSLNIELSRYSLMMCL